MYPFDQSHADQQIKDTRAVVAATVVVSSSSRLQHGPYDHYGRLTPESMHHTGSPKNRTLQHRQSYINNRGSNSNHRNHRWLVSSSSPAERGRAGIKESCHAFKSKNFELRAQSGEPQHPHCGGREFPKYCMVGKWSSEVLHGGGGWAFLVRVVLVVRVEATCICMCPELYGL